MELTDYVYIIFIYGWLWTLCPVCVGHIYLFTVLRSLIDVTGSEFYLCLFAYNVSWLFLFELREHFCSSEHFWNIWRILSPKLVKQLNVKFFFDSGLRLTKLDNRYHDQSLLQSLLHDAMNLQQIFIFTYSHHYDLIHFCPYQ